MFPVRVRVFAGSNPLRNSEDDADFALSTTGVNASVSDSIRRVAQIHAIAAPMLSGELPPVPPIVAQYDSPIAASAGTIPVTFMTSNNSAQTVVPGQVVPALLLKRYMDIMSARAQDASRPWTSEEAHCVASVNAMLNAPYNMNQSSTLALGIPYFCGGPLGGVQNAGFCAPSNLSSMALARAAYVRGTTQCPNFCCQFGQCSQAGQCTAAPGSCQARLAGLGSPWIDEFNSFVPPFNPDPMR